MAKREFTTEISNELMNIYLLLGIDKPINHEDIIQFVSEDVEASTNAETHTSENIKIAFRRLIETYEY